MPHRVRRRRLYRPASPLRGRQRGRRGFPARSGLRADVRAEDVRLQARGGGRAGARGAADEPHRAWTAARAHSGHRPGLRARHPRSARRRGASPTVEAAVARSDRAADIARRRRLARPVPEPRRGAAHPRATRASTGRRPRTIAATCRCIRSGATARRTLAEIAEACLARGYTHAAVTDHSHGLEDRRRHVDGRGRRAARGDRAPQRALRRPLPLDQRDRGQHRRRRPPRPVAPTRRPASSWCWPRRTRSCGEATTRPVACSPPSPRRASTCSRIRAAASPAAAPAWWRTGTRVFAAAAERGVAVEIDGDPSRQDLDFSLADACARGRLPVRARQRRAHHVAAASTPRPRSPTRGWPASRPSAS